MHKDAVPLFPAKVPGNSYCQISIADIHLRHVRRRSSRVRRWNRSVLLLLFLPRLSSLPLSLLPVLLYILLTSIYPAREVYNSHCATTPAVRVHLLPTCGEVEARTRAPLASISAECSSALVFHWHPSSTEIPIFVSSRLCLFSNSINNMHTVLVTTLYVWAF